MLIFLLWVFRICVRFVLFTATGVFLFIITCSIKDCYAMRDIALFIVHIPTNALIAEVVFFSIPLRVDWKANIEDALFNWKMVEFMGISIASVALVVGVVRHLVLLL